MFKARTIKSRTGNSVNNTRAGRRGSGRGPGGGSLGGLMLAGPVITVLCVASLPAVAGPRGERVVRGEASFNRQGRNTTITAGDRAIIEYDSFNIGRRQSVEFVQPGAGARVMNRITGGDPTAIRGSLKSNGIIYIVNPAGVIFGPNSVINVGGMYAAAATISDQDFVQGNDHFTNVQGRVVNHGSITGDSAVALIGRRVANFGSVVADTGTVTMVAGDEVWIGERGGHIYARFSTDAARERAGGVENHGTIVADQMLAGVGDYFALALFEPGAVRARIAEVRGGRGTTTHVAGVIDVSNHAAGGVGGQVTITGERVALRGAEIDASGTSGGGSVRVGGDYQGRGDIPNAERTYVSGDTTINASAMEHGDGGRVIVWSDVFTNYNGSITARGGAQGGDGGFAEVSGKEALAFNGRANLSAAAGDAGMLLLDPKNITIVNGGNAVVLSNNEFGEASGNNRSMDASDIVAILDAGTNLTLQANNDIVVDEAVTSVNPGAANGGNSGSLTLQAGRSVEVNQNVSLENAAFTATANETVANGVIDSERDDGAAVISMADGVSISTGSGNVSLTISTGAGLTAAGALSGNLTVEDITTTGTVSLTNNGPTAGSSIVVQATGPDSLITAGSLVMVVGGAGGGGSIGTAVAGEEIAFTATNVEASGQSGGIFLDTASAVNIGGASGSVTGLSTSAGGDISLTSAGAVTTSEAIVGTGELTLTGTTVGISVNVSANDTTVITGPVTITGSRTVSAGAGTLGFVNTVTMSGAAATVTLVGTPNAGTPGVTFQDTVTPDAGGTLLAFETPADGTAFNIATGNNDILEATNGIDQLQNGFTSITFGRATQTTNITVGASTFLDPLVVRTTSGNINLSGALAGTGNASITLTPGAASRVALNSNGAAITTAGGAITINGAVRVGEGFAVTIASGGGSIDVAGTVDGTNAGVAEAITFNAGAGTLDAGAIGGGQALDLEDATITNAGATTVGSVDLLGDFVTTNALTGGFQATGTVDADAITLNGTSFDFDGAVTSGAGGGAGAFTIGSTAATTLNFDSTVTGGSGGIDLTGTGMTFDALVSTTVGGDVDLDGAGITLTGGITTAGANGNATITNSGLLSLPAAVTTSGSFTQNNNVTGTVSVAAAITGLGVTFNSPTTVSGTREVSATTGALAFNSTLTFTGGGSTATLTGSTIAFAAAVTGAVGGGGTNLVFQSPNTTTDFGVGTGTANQMISSASIVFLQNGFTSIVFGRANASHDIDIAGVSFADPVTFRTTTAGDITVSGLLTGTDNATVLLDTSAANLIILDVTGNAIVTAGDLIDLAGPVRVAEGEDAIIDSNGGTIRFGGAVDGTTGGAAETLTLDAGAGSIDFQTTASAVSGASGAADATGLTDLTITDAGALDVQSILISGVFSTTAALTGAFEALGTVNAGTITLNGTSFDFDAAVTTGAGAFTIGSTAATTLNFDSTVTGGSGGIDLTGTGMTFDALVSTSGGGDLALDGAGITLTGGITTAGANANAVITNSGLLSLPAAVTTSGSFTQNNNVTGTASVAAAITGLGVTFNSPTTVSGTREISATTGALAFNGALTFSGAGATGTLTGDTIAFGGNVTADVGGTALVFQSPTTATAFGVGTGTGAQMISSASIVFLQEGFDSITFGRAAASHNIDIAGVTFSDPVSFRTTTAGNITVSGLLTGTDDASVLLDTGAGPARILLDVTGNAIVTAGDLIDLSGLVRVAEGEDAIIDSNGGTIRFGGAVDGTTGGAAETLTLDAGAGSIDFQTTASAVSGASGAADATGLTTLTITAADDLDLQSLLITGAFTTTAALTGDFSALGVVQAGTIDLNGTTFDFDGAVTGGVGGVTIGSTAATTINFDSTLTGGTGGIDLAGTAVTIDGNVDTNNADIDIAGTQITLGGAVASTGGAITFAGPVRIAAGINSLISSGGGNIAFGGAVDGTAGGGAEAITLNTGSGGIDLQTVASAISGAGGAASATGLTTVTIVNAGVVDVQSVAITGGFTTSNPLTGAFNAAGAVSAGTIDLAGTSFDFDSTVTAGAGGLGVSGSGVLDFGAAVSTSASGTVTLSGTNITLVSTLTTVGANSDVSITNSGLLDLGGLVVIGGAFTQVDNGGSVSISFFDLVNDEISTVGDLTFGSDVELNSGGLVTIASDGVMTFDGAIDMNGFDLTLASADLDLLGGPNSVGNSEFATLPATLTFTPPSVNTPIDIGDVTVAQAGAYTLDSTDIAALAPSVLSIAFGDEDDGEHNIQIEGINAANNPDAPFKFNVTFNSPNGNGLTEQIIVIGDLEASGARNLTFDGVTWLGNGTGGSASITTAGGAIEFLGNVRVTQDTAATITSGGGEIDFNFNVFGSTGGVDDTERLVVNAGIGDVFFDGDLSGQTGGTSNVKGLTRVTITGDRVDLSDVDITGLLSVNNAGTLNITADIDAEDGFEQAGPGDVVLGGNITTITTILFDGIEFTGQVTQVGDRELTAGVGSGSGQIEIGADFDTVGNNLTLSARDIDILGTLTGGDGTNTLTLLPDAVGTDIEIGNGTSLAAGALVLSATDISNIDDGFLGIVIGFAGTGAHDFEIGGAGFTDPLTLNAPAAGGSFAILANRTLSGTGNASIRFNGSHEGALTLNNGARITTAGTDIEIDDDVLLADGAGNSGLNADIPLISTGAGAGNITIDGSIRGTDNTSGLVERLRLQGGTGSIVVGDVLTVNGTSTNIFGALDGGLNPVASAEGLVDLSIVSAAGVTLEGVDIAGALETETALTGAFTASEAVLVQSLMMAGTTFDFVDGFEATNNAGGSALFTNSGLVTTTDGEATGDITTTGDLVADRLDSDGSIDVGGDLDLSDEAQASTNVTVTGTTTLGDRIIAGNNITLTGDVGFGTNGAATDRGLFAGNALTTGGGLNTSGQDTTLSGNEINFTGGDRSITGGGALAIEPANASRDINLGTPTAGNPTGTSLDLTDNDLAAIDDGFGSVTIGVAGGTHDLVFGTSQFRNAMVFNYQAGTALVAGNMFGAGPTASFEFLGGDSGGTTLSANITTAGGGILIDDNTTLGGNSTLSNTGGAGTIEIDGTLDGGFNFTAQGGTGLIEIDGVVGGTTPLAGLNLTADSVTLFNGIGTPGAAGVTGLTALTATNILTLGGETYNTNEAIYTTSVTGNILGTGSGSTATFTSNGNDISFDGGGTFDIDDGVDLVINTGGGLINLGAGFTGSAGAITFSSAVVLLTNTQITNQGTGPGSTITFGSTVDGAFDLDVTTAGGDIDFQGDIGATTALANLNVESGAGVLLENIGSGGTPGVDGSATIVASDGDITYNGTEYAMGSATLTASGQHSVASGATAFTTRGGDITFGGGNIVLTNGSDLSVSTDGGDATFTAIRGDSDENLSVDLGAGTGFFALIGTADEIGDIVLRMNNIALNGNVFGNTIAIEPGSNSRNIEIAGDGSVATAMRISRAEFARLRDGFTSITIGRSGANGLIVVGGDGGGAVAFTDPLTLLSPESLGSVVIQEDMNGAGLPGLTPASLTIDAGNVLLSADITTAGQDVTITGATALAGNASVATDGGNILFADGSTINSAVAAASLTLDAGTGDVTVTGDIGGVNPLESVDFTGAAIAVQAVATEGDQNYSGAVTLNGNLDAETGEVVIDGNTALGASVAITTGGDTTFRGTVDGNTNDLTVTTDGDAGIVAEGSISDVGVVQMTASTVSLRAVTSTGAQTYTADTTTINGDLSRSDSGAIAINGDLALAGNSSISTDGGSTEDDIAIDGDVNGAFSFNVAADEGNIDVTGDIGNTARLADMSIVSAGDVSLQGVRVTNFRQIDGTGQTAVEGELDVSGDTGVQMDSGSFRFEGSVNVNADMSLTSSEVSRFNNTVDVGGDVDLQGGSFRIGNNAADAFNVGGGLSVNSAGNLIVSAPVTVSGTEGATITAVDVLLSRALEVDAGNITLTNAGDFTLEETGSIVLNGNNFRQDGTGRSLLANGIASNGSNISFDGDIVMNDNLAFRGRSLQFNGEIDSDSAATRRALTLNSGGPVTLAGDIGRVNRISTLTTNANGETRLSADVFTAGRIEIGDNLILEGDSLLNAADGAAGGTIEFLGTINSESAASPNSLTVITDVSILDHTLPTITFTQSIGADAPLDNLFLNFQEGGLNGRSAVGAQNITINGFTLEGVTAPLVPTILMPFIEFDPNAPDGERGFFIETVGDFRMGQGEKLWATFAYDRGADGSFVLNVDGLPFINNQLVDASNRPTLGITAGGNVILGDVLVVGNFDVNLLNPATTRIEIQSRAGSILLPKPTRGVNDDQESYPGPAETLDVDDGTDLVVAGLVTFTEGPTGIASLGTTELVGFNTETRGDLILRSLELSPEGGESLLHLNDLFMTPEEAEATLGLVGIPPEGLAGSSVLNTIGRFSGFPLDPRAQGTTGFQPPIFGQIPNESQSGTVNQATSIGSVAKRALADLGINARDPDDLLDALIGRALYNDLVSGEGDVSYVTANRVSLDIATDLVNDYQAFFLETGEPQAPIIRARLTEAVLDYRGQSGGQFDPIAFRQLTQSNEAYAQVEQDLDTLEHLLGQFQILGLSSGEFSQARVRLLRFVKPAQGLNDQQFIAVIDAGDGVIEAPVSTPAEPERIIEERLPPAPSVP